MTLTPSRRTDRSLLYLIVSLTGAAVMVIELLGTRLIAPFYGTSLYVWSSLISVTMIALAAGYFAGGRWADHSGGRGLPVVIAGAGLLTVLIPLAARWVLLATDPLGLRAGAFVSALLLFFPALSLLGMVSPLAIKQATERLAGVGAGAGGIYAVSTLGSVAGTLLLGFYLFPRLGSREILTSVGALLLALGLVLALYQRSRSAEGRAAQLAVWVCGLLGLAGALLVNLALKPADPRATDGRGYSLLSDRESLYGWVRVLDNKAQDRRLLASDASVIGGATLSTGETLLEYQQIISQLPLAWPNIHRVLLIGQGAGHMAMAMRKQHGIVTDTVEIDPAVADAADQFFGFVPSGRRIVGDARYEIAHLQGPYDLIIHDCFTGGTEPVHLLTEETFQRLHRLLAPDGLLALNTVAFYENGRNPALASIVRTVAGAFAEHTVFRATAEDDFNDFVILASSKPIRLDTSQLGEDTAAWFKEREAPVDAKSGVVLTDNLNPLEHMQLQKSERYRAMVAEGLGFDLMLR